jgi:hypothetical protein
MTAPPRTTSGVTSLWCRQKVQAENVTSNVSNEAAMREPNLGLKA